ncbi:MAG: trigger factor [Deltaproteobacteria bacterium]|jgi:trigger factor|nr:trigger factor [Deltaproteobacteria bacterium]MBW2535698.1 trigger factor [Deltaproteobacteria bacterium]
MPSEIEKLSPVLVELRVEVPAQAVASEINKAYQSLQRTARVRGFRRGKAPRKVLTHLYGPAVEADVSKRLVEQSLQQALTEREMQPLTQPDVEPGELDPSSPFSFKARFEVRPEIEEVKWEGLEATRPPAEVSDESLEADIEQLRVQHATLNPVEDRPAKDGDVVTVGLRGEIDGEPVDEEVETTVASGELLPEIDQALPGLSVGSKTTVEATLPEGHPNPQLRGKSVSFVVELRELKERVLPEVDDEFARDCGDYDGLAALREARRAELKKRLDQRSEEDVARQLVAKLCEQNPVPVPPSLVEQQARISERELQQMAQMTGQPFQPNEQMRERVRADAEVKVRAGLLMAEIAKLKAVTVTEEDIEKSYAELAEQTGKNPAKVKAEYAPKGKREQLVGMILEDKILDLLESAAKISDASPSDAAGESS